MRFYRTKIIVILFVSALFFSADFGWVPSVPSAVAAANLNGRILLQVEDKGQAWYVNPLNSQRYYLGRPDDAFRIMRFLGLGVTNANLAAFKAKTPTRLSGRILLQVQDKGQAYYVSPVDLKLYYLGRPTDAFNLMREKGLGISNFNLDRIVIFNATAPVPALGHFNLKYQNNNYEIVQDLSADWYRVYQNSPKTYTYSGNADLTTLREAFYGLFFNIKPGDTSLADLVVKLRAVAANNNWTNDQLAEFALALVQYIPYDHAKLAQDSNRNNNPYYPYETLYLDRGVCSDKTFLAVALLRQLGYGAAILDFPEKNHSAAGISCPIAESLNGSGYCYVETTNYFPLGAIPQSISAGQADTVSNDFTNLFTTAALGRIEIYQTTAGETYNGVTANRAKALTLQSLKEDLAVRQSEVNAMETSTRAEESSLKATKAQMDSYYNNGQTAQYNSLVSAYNEAVNKYNADLAIYRQKIAEYNQIVAQFNQAMKEFYQK
jgi:hypothetical protein